MTAFATNIALDTLNTFKVKANASQFIQINSVQQLQQQSAAIAECGNRFVLGGGSNLLFLGDFEGLVIYPQLKGIKVLEDTQDSVLLNVAASENWHEFVQYCLANGYFGLENLALIPGTVGAAPVQNIGAYGVEIEQFIKTVECYDLIERKLLKLSHQACKFEYRDSLIKRAGQGRYLVTSVDLQLSKHANPVLTYKPLKEFFTDKAQVTPQAVFDEVCRLRNSKLPNPDELPNAGSFFKNPVISGDHYHKLKEKHPLLVAFPVTQSSGSDYKVAAGWLIEQAGFKGKQYGGVGVHRHQALVLVNYSDQSGENIWKLANKIIAAIDQMFDIQLEPEVRVLGG